MDLVSGFSDLLSSSKQLGARAAWYYEDKAHEKFELSVPLQRDYTTVEGITLRGTSHVTYPDQAVTFSILYHKIGDLAGSIVRFDWKPFHSHSNNGRVKGAWRWKSFTCTHHHLFELNSTLGWERMARENLPLALPVDKPLARFREMLEYLGEQWNITDIQKVPEPEWSSRLA